MTAQSILHWIVVVAVLVGIVFLIRYLVRLQKPGPLLLTLVGILLVGACAALLVPVFAGKKPVPNAEAATMVWTALFFYLWWKRRSHKGWHGALIGLMIGFFVVYISVSIGGYLSHGAKV